MSVKLFVELYYMKDLCDNALSIADSIKNKHVNTIEEHELINTLLMCMMRKLDHVRDINDQIRNPSTELDELT